jgi:hypothetical protein
VLMCMCVCACVFVCLSAFRLTNLKVYLCVSAYLCAYVFKRKRERERGRFK